MKIKFEIYKVRNLFLNKIQFKIPCILNSVIDSFSDILSQPFTILHKGQTIQHNHFAQTLEKAEEYSSRPATKIDAMR